MRGVSGFRLLGLIVVLLAALGAAFSARAAGPLHVLRVTPAGPDVPPGQEIVFKFDRAMVPLGDMARARQDVPIRIEPALKCTWRWLDTDELACRLPGQQRFRPATRYRIRVGTDFKALDGAELAQPVTQTFTTQLPAATWFNFRQWRSPVTPVYLMNFNLPVTAAAVARSVVFMPQADTGGAPARAEPFNKERDGPLLLPVPGVPGAVAWIEDPQPVKPADAGKPAYAARKTWLVVPAHPLAPGAAYSLTLKPGLTTPLGSLPGTGGLRGNAGFTTFGPFRFRGVACATADSDDLHLSPGATVSARCRPGSVQLAFSAPVPASTLAAVHWDPAPVPADKLAEAWGDYPRWWLGSLSDSGGGGHDYASQLPFELAPMQAYTVSVPAGVTDRFGRALSAATSMSVATGHLPPSIDTSDAGGLLEQTQDTILPVRFANLSKLDLDYRLLESAALGASAPAGATSASTVSLLAPFHGTPPADRHFTVPLGIRGLLGGGSGVVTGMLRWQPHTSRWDDGETHVFGQVSPWQAFAKLGHFGSLVWITSLSSGAPVAGVDVRLYRAWPKDLNGIEPASITARTGPNGLAVLPGTVIFGRDWTERWNSKKKSWYLGATKQGAMALLPLDWSYLRSIGDASDYSLYSDTASANGHVRAWALTAQGVYRPGATVHYAGYVRGEGNTTLTDAPKLAYTLTITDPTGKTVAKREHVALSPFGGLHGDLTIPDTAATGWYRIDIAWPVDGRMQAHEAGRFLVTEFVPASFKVHTLLAGSLFGPGSAVKAEAQARLHAGGPYTQAAVRFDVRVQAESFVPDTPAAAGFSFDANPENAPDSVTLYQDKTTLDGSGNADVETTLPDDTPIIYGRLRVQGAVESERGTWVADRASALYAARDRFVGLKYDGWLLHAGKAVKVHYLATDARGTPQAGSPVKLVLERQTITVANVANGSGGFETQHQTKWLEEDHCTAISATAPGMCELTPRHAGTYRIVGTVTDTQGRTQQSALTTWAVGPGTVLWKPGASVTLVPDKTSYKPGDTARVLVQNPYPGTRALVTVERYGILWKQVVTLQGSTPVLDIPIQPDFFPGAYLSVAIFSPRVAKPGKKADLGKPTLALGYVALPVAGAGSSLDVKVKPARTEYKPRQTVDVDVAVKDADGKPAAHTRLVAAVVDEAVLDLLQGGAGYYDPRKAFYAPPDGPDILNYSLISKLGTTKKAKVMALMAAPPPGKKGVTPGGGGGAGSLSVRSIFKYTADWQPALETDAKGTARFNFKLPDNLTGWRIVVMALTPGQAMGVGAATVRANLPLQLGPALPNQVHAGDRFSAGFSVTNRTQATHDVKVDIKADGAGVKGAHADTTLDLASFTHKIAWFDLAPSTSGVLKFLATARSGNLGDALEKTVPVKTAGAEEVAASYGSLTQAEATVPVKLPADALPGTAKLDVTLAPTALANLDGAFTHMRDDPLETWEMRLSRSVMASDYLSIRDALPASVQWPRAAAEIETNIAHAADFQAPDGGMAFWIPRNAFVSPYLSTYTALAFDWLQAAGHSVPADVRENLDDYLENTILAARPDDYEHNAPILQAAAMAALALQGKLKQGRVAGLMPKLQQLNLFGKSLLLQAALATHDEASARRITQTILAHAEETGGSIAFQETWADAYASLLATPLRANCAVLDALVAARNGPDTAAIGDLPNKLLRWIDARRATGGGWPNSQENVFCTTAAVHYAAAYEQPVHDLAGRVSAGGRDVGHAQFASRHNAPQSLSAAAPAGAANVTVAHAGTGRLYYGVRLAYQVPPQSIGAADAGFTVERQYYVQQGADWVRLAPGTALARGAIVRVDLTVDVPAERHYVVLSDPLPGAFEAVNHQLETADATAPTHNEGGTVLWFDYGAWPNYAIVTGGFYHREIALDAVRFYADDLPAGHYHLIYAAQVIAPGRFLAPAPHIKEIYQPDVFGRGVATHITVAPPAATQ